MLRRLRRAGRDTGLTLVELLVSTVLTGVVGSLTVAAVVNVQSGYLKVDNDQTGLLDVRTVQERMSRDLRQARGIAPGATSDQLRLWIDQNSDYVRPADGSEEYVWRVVDLAGAAGTGRKQVERVQVSTNKATVIGRTLVSSALFTYDNADVTKSKVVAVDVTYSAKIGRRTQPKHVTFSIRMRNVE